LRRKVNEINLSYGLRSALDQPLGLYILLVFNTFKKPKTGILLEIRDLPWPFRCLFGVVPHEANKGQALCLGEAGHAAFAAASLEPPRPFGPALDNIDIKSLLIEEDSPKIENVTYVASYNWLDGAHPVILVPGQS
jgi:hypothetical protein